MNFASIRRFTLPLGSALLSSFLLWGNIAKANISISPMVVETEAKRGQAQGRIYVSNPIPLRFSRSRLHFTLHLR